MELALEFNEIEMKGKEGEFFDVKVKITKGKARSHQPIIEVLK